MTWWCCYPGGAWESITTVDEFGAGHTDACGPAANENAQACLEGSAPTYAHMDAIRTYDMAHGHFSNGGGQTIVDVDWDLHNWAELDRTVLHGFQPNLAVYGLPEVTAALEACGRGTDGSGRHPGALIVEVASGHNWPNNEPGVNVHFGAVLAYDSMGANLGGQGAVYLANSDREPLPKGTGKPEWVSLPAFLSASIIGMVEVYRKVPPAPPTPPPPPPETEDTDYTADIAALSTQAQSVYQAILALHLKMAQNGDAK